MKRNNYILLLSLFLLVSQFVRAQSKEPTLPVFDLSKDYSLKKVYLHEMADIVYVPLETTDELLVGGEVVLSAVTDKYILVHEPQRGDIFVFDCKTGKIVSHFNHKGQSGMEYAWIKNGVVFDSKTEEIYVCSQYIQVYSLQGEYKRTLKINGFANDMKIFNFDDKSLLIYDDVIIEPGRENKTKQDPYRLVSKEDGSLISVLNIHFSKKRISNMVAQQKDGNMWRPFKYHYPHNAYSGQHLMLMDISSDTLYQLSPLDGLSPILQRKPSVYASDPRNIWTPFLTTDKFIFFGTLVLDFNKTGGKLKFWMYDFIVNKFDEVSIVDTEYDMSLRPGDWAPEATPVIAKNKSADLIQATSMLEAYKGKRLKGNGMEVAKILQEDDNPIVRILTFK